MDLGCDLVVERWNLFDEMSGGGGGRLCGLLSELGYNEDEESKGVVDPDSLEWPFQYDEARSILDWLCSSLRPSNVLTPSELNQLTPHPPFLFSSSLSMYLSMLLRFLCTHFVY